MAILRSTYGSKRLAVVLFALLLAALFLLPSQSQGVLQFLGGPIGQVLSVPLEVFSSLDRGMTEIWEGYVALRGIREENRQLRKQLEFVQGQNNQLREATVATQRLEALLDFKQKSIPDMIAAQVIGRDATNWYRGIILNKGEQNGVRAEMGVVTPAGVVGRVVKTTSSSSVVLLMTDPNNAIAALVQGTRDEGIVEGTRSGRARMKYIPLLSTVHPGDRVITSGLTGSFPRGLAIGVMTHIQQEEGDVFRSAELEPEVDMTKLDEVLVIRSPYEEAEASKKMIPGMPGEKRKP
ncbi:MAG: rod shape-determining protein MreC [Nitrospiraceae bacterium]